LKQLTSILAFRVGSTHVKNEASKQRLAPDVAGRISGVMDVAVDVDVVVVVNGLRHTRSSHAKINTDLPFFLENFSKIFSQNW